MNQVSKVLHTQGPSWINSFERTLRFKYTINPSFNSYCPVTNEPTTNGLFCMALIIKVERFHVRGINAVSNWATVLPFKYSIFSNRM